MLIYDDFSKKCHVIFKKLLLLLWKFVSYLILICVPSFTSINCSSLSRKECDGNNFTPPPPPPPLLQVITRSKCIGGNRVNWTHWAFWYIELQAIFWTLHFTRILHVLHVFLLFILVWNKIFCFKNWTVF